MSEEVTQSDLEAYLDEALDAERASWLEKQLRANPELVQKLSMINARRDAGLHTLGEIWRRFQIGVPSREQLSGFLAGTLNEETADYIQFRIEILKCPYTIASLNDLRREQEEPSEVIQIRRAKYFRLSRRVVEED